MNMMKTWKNIGLVVLTAIITIALFACGDNNGDNNPTCQCPDLDEHWLTCEEYGCKIGGHEQKPRAEITEVATEKYPEGRKIPIYQTKGVTDEEAIAIAPKIVAGYDSWPADVTKTEMAEDEFMQEIRIIVGTGSPTGSCTADGLITVGTDRVDNDTAWRAIFSTTVNNAYFAQIQLCTCNPKAHLGIDETCTCGGTGCDCELQNYNTENLFGSIPVYRIGAETEDTDTQMTTAKAMLSELWTWFGIFEKENLQNNFDCIHIMTTGNTVHQGKILKIKYDADPDKDVFTYLENNKLF